MLKEKKYDQATIVKLLAEDNHYAFQMIFDSHRDQIYKVALIYLKSPILAEEVVQDTFLKLWFKRKELSGLISLEAWLYTVSKNLILNYFKKLSHEWLVRKNFPGLQGFSENAALLKISNAEINILLNNAVHNLSEQQRTVFKLAKEDGLTYEEIGLQLSISSKTVKTHMARALASIRSYIRQHSEMIVFILTLQSIKFL